MASMMPSLAAGPNEHPFPAEVKGQKPGTVVSRAQMIRPSGKDRGEGKMFVSSSELGQGSSKVYSRHQPPSALASSPYLQKEVRISFQSLKTIVLFKDCLA